MEHPGNTTELCMFIGCMNNYRYMWPRCAHILKPLTDQSGMKKKSQINWTDKMQKAFNKMHLLMAANALAAYLNHNMQFDVYSDDSDLQLGASFTKEDLLPTSLASWQSHSRIILSWKKKCFPLLLPSKNFKVCSLVQTFTFLRTIKFDIQYPQNSTCITFAYKNWLVFTHVTLHRGPPQYSSQ